MEDPQIQVGQTRSQPDSDAISSQPIGKKPRLDNSADGGSLVTVPEHQKLKKGSAKQKKRRQKHSVPEPFSSEDVLWRDVVSLLGKEFVDRAIEDGTEWDSPFDFREELEVKVACLSSGGESLSLGPSHKTPWIIITPFSLPGETIRVRVYRSGRLHSFADLLEVVDPNPALRDQERVNCKYFGECAGCQYQMLSYETQLDLKRTVIVKAYQTFSGLPDTSVPAIGATIPSPLQYGYRTKITPHFDAPPKKLQKNPPVGEEKPEWLKIGFNHIGKRQVMDIEECPIATPVLNEALGPMRKNIAKNIYTYKKGVSLLLRDSLEIPPTATATNRELDAMDVMTTSMAEAHICVTDHKATVRERVGSMVFEYPGGSFFQNNNSVLVPLTDYVREAIFPIGSAGNDQPTHLVDAYCGSGLFAITLSSHFTTVSGIELSSDSIKSATHNAQLNNLPRNKLSFLSGDAANIFATVQHFPPAKTVLIIDPPRKGCDERFIEQLVRFGAGCVVYVSCNVHTQARDVGEILRRTKDREGGGYVLETLRGFDLFPQTAHVESVALLRLCGQYIS